jgi:hypothetical protein
VHVACAMRGPAIPALALLAACCLSFDASAQGAEDRRPADGIVAIVGAVTGDEGAATSLLASDVALEGALSDLLAGRAPVEAQDAARERAALGRTVLVALLARQAILSGEDVDPAAKQAIVDRVTASAGGAEAIADLLERYGARGADLAAWAGDVALAARQIEYLRERIEPPSDKELLGRFERGDHPFRGSELKDVKHRLRAFVVDEALRAAIGAQLAEAIEQGAVRVFR